MAQGFVYGGNTILSHPIFVETILPFILVFTIVFAVLQKSKIFGDGKKQIDALVALVTGLIVISFAQATGIIVQIVPFLAVSLVVILVLLLLLGSFAKDPDKLVPGPVRIILIVAVMIAVVVAVLYITNAWTYIFGFIFTGGGSSEIFLNAVFIAIIVAAVVAVLVKTKGGDKKD